MQRFFSILILGYFLEKRVRKIMEHITRYINRIGRLSGMYRREFLKEYGLNGIHHTYIINICHHPGVSQEELAQMIFVNKSNVTRQLAYLEKEGFIYRQPSREDKRKSLVYPTQKAQDILPLIQNMLREWNEKLLVDIPENEQEIVLKALKKIMATAQVNLEEVEEEA